jgi:ORF6N domain
MSKEMIPIESQIHLIRGQKVMLASDLAGVYGVETRTLNQAVKRNAERFPADFMFQLSAEEADILKSHSVTSNWGGAPRALPYAFTEQGVCLFLFP